MNASRTDFEFGRDGEEDAQGLLLSAPRWWRVGWWSNHHERLRPREIGYSCDRVIASRALGVLSRKQPQAPHPCSRGPYASWTRFYWDDAASERTRISKRRGDAM